MRMRMCRVPHIFWDICHVPTDSRCLYPANPMSLRMYCAAELSSGSTSYAAASRKASLTWIKSQVLYQRMQLEEEGENIINNIGCPQLRSRRMNSQNNILHTLNADAPPTVSLSCSLHQEPANHLGWAQLAADCRIHLTQLPPLPGLLYGVTQPCKVDAPLVAVIPQVVIPAVAAQSINIK